jgi:hypothetical protein
MAGLITQCYIKLIKKAFSVEHILLIPVILYKDLKDLTSLYGVLSLSLLNPLYANSMSHHFHQLIGGKCMLPSICALTRSPPCLSVLHLFLFDSE